MFSTLQEVINFYGTNQINKHEVIYKEFEKNVNEKNAPLCKSFNDADGFGELAFCWNWELLVKVMPDNFSFLEIGVYKGRTLGVVQILANQQLKACKIYGVTPLSNVGDKYSVYENTNYSHALLQNLAKMNVDVDNIDIIQGLSTEPIVNASASELAQYDIIYIGCHDYEVLCQDIKNYVPMLKVGGYLVMDDASLLLENPFGRFLGHQDVCRAIKDNIDGRLDLQHLFAIGHNRVWQKTEFTKKQS